MRRTSRCPAGYIEGGDGDNRYIVKVGGDAFADVDELKEHGALPISTASAASGACPMWPRSK